MSIKYKLNHTLRIFTATFALCSISFISNGQITTGDKEAPPKKEKKEKTNTGFNEDSLTGTNYYLTGLSQWSYRTFEDQTPFGSLAARNDETYGFGHGLSAGVILPLADYLSLDIGVSYWTHHENYAFSDSISDSTFNYNRKYLQLGIPLRIRASYGDQIQGFLYGGVTPMNILQIRYDTDYSDATGQLFDPEKEVIKNSFAPFNLMVSIGAGINYNFNLVGFTLSLEYRRNMLNSYDVNELRVDHRMYGIALNYGMYLRF